MNNSDKQEENIDAAVDSSKPMDHIDAIKRAVLLRFRGLHPAKEKDASDDDE